MTQQGPSPPIAAVVFERAEDVDAILAGVVHHLHAEGIAVGGQLQRFGDQLPNGKRSMWVEDIATGARLRIDLPRGADARGCSLDADALATASCNLRAVIAAMPDILFVNRFGCSEAEGGGMRAEIGEAICAGIPLLIAVRSDLLPAWRDFIGDDAKVLPPSLPTVITTARVMLGPELKS